MIRWKKCVRKIQGWHMNKTDWPKKKSIMWKSSTLCENSMKKLSKGWINWKAKLLVAQLRTDYHLRWQSGGWMILKKEWEERTYIFYNNRAVETEWHFIIECVTYENIHIQYRNNLKDRQSKCVFRRDEASQGNDFLIKIHNKKSLETMLRIYLLIP